MHRTLLPVAEVVFCLSEWRHCVPNCLCPTNSIDRSIAIIRKIIPTIAFAIGVSTAAIAQQPAPMTSGPAEIFSVRNFYKQNVYDPSDNKIGEVDDLLIDKEVVSRR